MKFCREFRCLPDAGGYFDQPADLMVQWHQMLGAEGEGHAMRLRLEEARARARQH